MQNTPIRSPSPKTIDEEHHALSPQHTIDPHIEIGDKYTFLDDDDFSNDDEEDSEEEEEGDDENDNIVKDTIDDVTNDDDDQEDDEDDEDEEEFEQVQNFEPEIDESVEQPISRKLTREDAESIVGGESIEQVYQENKLENEKHIKHPKADPNKPTEDQDIKVGDNSFDAYKMKNYNPSQKVFSFSLPFGGLESIRNDLSKKLQNFKIDVPFVNNNHEEENNRKSFQRDIELRLERQQSISTVDEANYFKNFKGTDAGRLRAVKHTISSNLGEIIPHKKKSENDYESIYDRIDGNIVIMGGYRGSILRDTKTKKRVWIPLKAGFHLKKIDLLLGPNKEDELNAEEKLYPDGVLKNVGPIDICKKLIKKLDSNPKVNIKEFGYDWRLGGDYVTNKLEKFLTQIYEETGKPTLVIAHSMGGIMAHGTMQKNPKLFRSIIYVGSPSECLNILGPIRFGDSVILSDKILTFETNFMMRSSFLFLPLSGETFYNKTTKENYKIDFFNPDSWVEYNLNPLVSEKRKQAAELQQQKKKISSQSTSGSVSSLTNGSIDHNIFKKSTSPSSSISLNSSSTFPSINSISSTFSKLYRSSSLKKNSKSNGTNLSSSSSTTMNNPSSSPPTTSPLTSTKQTTEPENQAIPEQEHFSFSFADSYRYLSETLESTKKFVKSLEFDPNKQTEYPPMAIVYGNTIPSVRGSVVTSRQDIKDGNYYEFFYGHGDGVIHQKWLMPEKKGFRYYDKSTGQGEIVGKFSSSCAHVNLLTDFDAIGKGLNAVFEAEKFWEKKKMIQKLAMKKVQQEGEEEENIVKNNNVEVRNEGLGVGA
ncbi:uncharacterized protein KGF55_003691 [Candida pseudojiufengensis]|uniref:uncharacterized protein n=1 Tax=Candida pseudojiufengensis TaxID=497109 RepID=UPI002225AFEE|nr:uncharacterized protein KGF55_003691 [Candida pseudojiufengensis]KAI5962615.1 hypothetical protein KGF55_003691 [Candida pseudojiufengensis]